MANLDHFILNSDYPTDKIVFLRQGEFRLNELGDATSTIEHELGAQVYMKGIWSTDGWNTTYTFGMRKYGDQYVDTQSEIWATDKTISMHVVSKQNATVQYKIWGVLDEDNTMNIDTEPTLGYSSNALMFDSDLNYPRLVAEGHLKKGESYKHGQNKIPFVDIWYQSPYVDGYMLLDVEQMGGPAIRINKDEIIAANDDRANGYYFRIYA